MKNIIAIFLSSAFCFATVIVFIRTMQGTAVVVSADKMNVFYVGVDNPVSVAVPGYTSDKVSAVLSKNGTLTLLAPGKYIAHVSTLDLRGETAVQVYAEMPNGVKKLMGEVNFRVKRVPDPVMMIGTFKGGPIKAELFKVQKGVYATLENFEYDIRFSVIEFEMTYVSSKNTSNTLSAIGPLFTKEMLEILIQSKPGDKFFFDKVKVKGPDSTIRLLPTTAFYLI
jgi:hypothetical protein